jgi:hypothetical protein
MKKADKERFAKDPFFCFGRVHASEWDWATEMHQLAIHQLKHPEAEVAMDICKLLGLCRYIADLEEELRSYDL